MFQPPDPRDAFSCEWTQFYDYLKVVHESRHFFTGNEWRAGDSTALSSLCDIGTSLSPLSASIYQMESAKAYGDRKRSMQHIMVQLNKLHDSLDGWCFRHSRNPYFAKILSKVHELQRSEDDEDTDLQNVALDAGPSLVYHDLSTALTLMDYWAMRIMIGMTIKSLLKFYDALRDTFDKWDVGTSQSPMNGMTEMEQTKEELETLLTNYEPKTTRHFATNIVRSISYAWDEDMRDAGRERSWCSLRIAMLELASYPGMLRHRCYVAHEQCTEQTAATAGLLHEVCAAYSQEREWASGVHSEQEKKIFWLKKFASPKPGTLPG